MSNGLASVGASLRFFAIYASVSSSSTHDVVVKERGGMMEEPQSKVLGVGFDALFFGLDERGR